MGPTTRKKQSPRLAPRSASRRLPEVYADVGGDSVGIITERDLEGDLTPLAEARWIAPGRLWLSGRAYRRGSEWQPRTADGRS